MFNVSATAFAAALHALLKCVVTLSRLFSGCF